VENHNVNDYIFNEQLHTFNNTGVAMAPSGNAQIIRSEKDTRKIIPGNAVSIAPNWRIVGSDIPFDFTIGKKRKPFGDPSDTTGNFNGPWAPYEDEEVINEKWRKLQQEHQEVRFAIGRI
jgi:hypothetical protein